MIAPLRVLCSVSVGRFYIFPPPTAHACCCLLAVAAVGSRRYFQLSRNIKTKIYVDHRSFSRLALFLSRPRRVYWLPIHFATMWRWYSPQRSLFFLLSKSMPPPHHHSGSTTPAVSRLPPLFLFRRLSNRDQFPIMVHATCSHCSVT